MTFFPNIMDYRDRNVHIVGISGAEGFEIARYLCGHGFTGITGHDMTPFDRLRDSFNLSHVSLSRDTRETAFQELIHLPVSFRLAEQYLQDIETADLIFAGQNWFAHAANAPIQAARDRGVPVLFITQLYFELSPAPIAAITGTNGKTTVSNLLFYILKHAGIPVMMSGNDRYHSQVLNTLHTLPAHGALVLEISNRQLLELHKGPHVGIITNITEDHIAEHGSFEAYIQTKARLFQLQTPRDFAVINADNIHTAPFAAICTAHPILFSTRNLPQHGAGMFHETFGIRTDNDFIPLFRPIDLKLPGNHNFSNALAAATAAYLLKASPEKIQAAIRSFPGVKNRIEWIAEVNGIQFYDDLASTNPAATAAAVSAFKTPVILICGCNTKGNEEAYSDLKQTLSQNIKHISALPGTAGDLLSQATSSPISRPGNLEEAMREISRIATPGDVVLLSPGGAGFYTQYIASGKGFRRLIRDFTRQVKK